LGYEATIDHGFDPPVVFRCVVKCEMKEAAVSNDFSRFVVSVRRLVDHGIALFVRADASGVDFDRKHRNETAVHEHGVAIFRGTAR
jgi:hypothetical protein